MALAGPSFPLTASGGELGQVSHGEAAQRPSGLDQQPDGDLGPGREPDPFGEPEFGRGGEEPVQISGQR